MRYAIFLTGMISFLSFFSSSAFAVCPNPFDLPCACENHPNYCIATGDKNFTYYTIGQDLAKYVAPDAGIDLMAVAGGSIQNVQKMRYQDGVKLSIVQSDVLQHYEQAAKAGYEYASHLISPLRVILPLYYEEVHIVVRSDSSLKSFKDLYNKRIALGSITGGSAMTGSALYALLFNEDIPENNAVFSNADEALKALTVDKTVDAWIMVAGQAAKRFAELPAAARDHIKLLSFNANDPQEKAILQGAYYPTAIKKAYYPWLTADVPTVAVQSILITQKYKNAGTKKKITRFTESLCKNFAVLQKKGHNKWHDINLELSKLSGGWKYSEDVKKGFMSKACRQATSAVKTQKTEGEASSSCSTKERVLGLCK